MMHAPCCVRLLLLTTHVDVGMELSGSWVAVDGFLIYGAHGEDNKNRIFDPVEFAVEQVSYYLSGGLDHPDFIKVALSEILYMQRMGLTPKIEEFEINDT